MTSTLDLEARLRDLFDEQQRGVIPPTRASLESGVAATRPRARAAVGKPPPARVALVAACVAAAIVLVAGLVLITSRAPDGSASTPPGSPAISLVTPQVSLTATALAIEINGTSYTPHDASISSDPGGPDYQTLEVEWPQNNVEMRLFFYFASDGTNWWVSEMRTYNGNDPGEWVTFDGPCFETPLGTAYLGDVDMTASEGGVTSRLVISGMSLRPFVTVGSATNVSTGQSGPTNAISTVTPGDVAPSADVPAPEPTKTTSSG